MTETENKSFIGRLGDTISEKWASLGDNQAIFVIFVIVAILVLVMAIVSVRSSRKSAISAITDELDELASDIRSAETLENAQKVIYVLLYAIFASSIVSYLSHRSISKIEKDQDKLDTLTQTLTKNEQDIEKFIAQLSGHDGKLFSDKTLDKVGRKVGIAFQAVTPAHLIPADKEGKNYLEAMIKYANSMHGVDIPVSGQTALTKEQYERAIVAVVIDAETKGDSEVATNLFLLNKSLYPDSALTEKDFKKVVIALRGYLENDDLFSGTKVGDVVTKADAQSNQDFLDLKIVDALKKVQNEIHAKNILSAVNSLCPKDESKITITKWEGIFVNPLNGEGFVQKAGLFLQDIVGIVCFPFAILDYLDHTIVNVDNWYISSGEKMGLVQHPDKSASKKIDKQASSDKSDKKADSSSK